MVALRLALALAFTTTAQASAPRCAEIFGSHRAQFLAHASEKTRSDLESLTPLLTRVLKPETAAEFYASAGLSAATIAKIQTKYLLFNERLVEFDEAVAESGLLDRLETLARERWPELMKRQDAFRIKAPPSGDKTFETMFRVFKQEVEEWPIADQTAHHLDSALLYAGVDTKFDHTLPFDLQFQLAVSDAIKADRLAPFLQRLFPNEFGRWNIPEVDWNAWNARPLSERRSLAAHLLDEHVKTTEARRAEKIAKTRAEHATEIEHISSKLALMPIGGLVRFLDSSFIKLYQARWQRPGDERRATEYFGNEPTGTTIDTQAIAIELIQREQVDNFKRQVRNWFVSHPEYWL